MNDSDDWAGESGPFCRHWGDPSDCEIVCARVGCAHRCNEHAWGDGAGTACDQDGCACAAWLPVIE